MRALDLAPRARHAKSKARISAYESLLAQKGAQRDAGGESLIPRPPHLGDDVVVAEDVSKAFGDRLLFEEMSFRLPPGGIVGVIGPNGAGKTTLFRMIMGEEHPTDGRLTVGKTVTARYVDQSREALNANR